MNSIVVALTLLLAIAAASAEVPSNDITAFDYHRRFGIPEASRIKRAEEQALRVGAERIVGGSNTDISEIPYQVGLVIRTLWVLQSVCGGTLISETRVLTAAHCHTDGFISANSYTVVLGSNFLFSGGVRMETSDVAVHPRWTPSTAENDIAVLRISPVFFTDNIQAIALPSSVETTELFVGQTGLASGYGATRDGGGVGIIQRLSSVNVPVITNADCAAIFGPSVHDSNVCTSGAGGMGTCQGDSGGPLTVVSNGRRILVGVTSYIAAIGCSAGFPTAYARVTSYLSFILSA